MENETENLSSIICNCTASAGCGYGEHSASIWMSVDPGMEERNEGTAEQYLCRVVHQ